MAGLESDTIGGFNGMLHSQQKQEGECRISTVLFSNQISLLHDRLELPEVGELTEKDYLAGGCTALLDAMGFAIEKIDGVQKSVRPGLPPIQVMVVIITDGLENCSRKYTREQITAMVEEKQKEFGWQFIFLGANMDAIAAAREVGIAADHAVDYIADTQGTELNFQMMSETISKYRATRKLKAKALDVIRADQSRRKGKSKPADSKKMSGKNRKAKS